MEMTHLDDEQVVDALDAGPASAHALACPACARRVQELRDALQVAGHADIPEPPPFFWASFRRQVGRRIEEETSRATRPRAWAAVAALASAAALAVVLHVPELPPPAAAATLPSWSALPDDDPASDVLGILEPDAEIMREAGCGAVADCVAGLTDAESSALVALLRDELAPGGKL